MNEIIDSFTRTFDYKGRSSRRQFWYLFALLFLVAFVFGLLDPNNTNILFAVVQIVVTIPYIALFIRRMHDINKRGWFMLIPLYSIYLAAKKGDTVANRFGEPVNVTKK